MRDSYRIEDWHSLTKLPAESLKAMGTANAVALTLTQKSTEKTTSARADLM